MSDIEIPQPNGSLMLAWQVRNKHVLVVGGGDVAISRVNHLLQADAKITIVARDVDPILRKYEELGLLFSVIQRDFEMADLKLYEKEKPLKYKECPSDESEIQKWRDELEDYHNNRRFAMVLTAIDDHELSERIYYVAKQLKLNVNIADRPKQCDFYFGSTLRRGSLQVMISSNGKSPRFCNKIKTQYIEPALSGIDVDVAVENLYYLRAKLKDEVCAGDTNEKIKTRMSWNKFVSDMYDAVEWSKISKDEIDKMLDKFPELPERQ